MKTVVVLQLKDHVLLQPDAGLDTTTYTTLARRVLAGDLTLGPGLYYVSPLYIYFLAAVLRIADSFVLARLAQVALGTAAVALIFLGGREWFGERAAWTAAVLAALTGLITLYEALLLQAALDPFLTAAALALLAIGLNREGRRWFLLAGVASGLLILNRPNAVVPVVAVGLTLLLQRRIRPAALVLAGLVLVMTPIAIRNGIVAGEWSALPSQGGLNFFIGNNPNADGTYRPVSGISPTIEGQQYDARRVAERASGRQLTDSEVSRYFVRLGIEWIAAHPAAALKLFAWKVGYVFNAGPIFLNVSYPFFAYDARTLLRALVVGPGLLIPLGLVGATLALVRLRRSEFVAWVLFVPFYALSTAAFFVSDRYQLPLLIPCAMTSGVALDALATAAAARSIAAVARLGLAVLGLAVFANWPWHLDDGRAETRARLAERLIHDGRYDEAEVWARRAEEGYPNPAVLQFRIGHRFLLAHQPGPAVTHLERALQLDPAQPEVEYRLGQALLQTGRIDEAIPHLRSGLRAASKIDLAGYDLARALAAMGHRDAALDALQHVRPSASNAAQNDVALGELALQLQAPGMAEAFFRRALAAQPDLASAHQQLGLCLGVTGRTDEAIVELGEAVRLDSSDPSSHLNLAVVLAQRGRFSEARAHAERALELNPSYERARELLRAMPR